MVLERKYYNIDISIVLPTRKRVDRLNETIYSILSLADESNINFEIIIKADYDDIDTIDYMKNYSNEYVNIKFLISSRLGGWLNMVDYVEDMIDIAKGKWILNVNDDMVFTSKNWNTIIMSHLDKFCICYPQVNGYKESFPVYPKKLKHILGHISPHNQIDTYLYTLGNHTGINKYVTDVTFYHHQNEIEDETHLEKGNLVNINFKSRNYHFNSEEFQNDIQKLKNYLKNEIF